MMMIPIQDHIQEVLAKYNQLDDEVSDALDSLHNEAGLNCCVMLWTGSAPLLFKIYL